MTYSVEIAHATILNVDYEKAFLLVASILRTRVGQTVREQKRRGKRHVGGGGKASRVKQLYAAAARSQALTLSCFIASSK